MSWFFDYIPIVAPILFAIGIVCVIVYERARTKNIEESSNWKFFWGKIPFIRIWTVNRDTEKRIANNLSKIAANDFSLIVIDNATDLFSFEYSKKEQSLEKHLAFMKYMQNLASIAINSKIPIVVTNIVRSFNENEEENLEKSIGMFTHTKIRLKKNANGFQCQVVSPFINKKFQYNITSSGLTDGS